LQDCPPSLADFLSPSTIATHYACGAREGESSGAMTSPAHQGNRRGWRQLAGARARAGNWLLTALFALVAVVSVSASTARADDADDRRVRAGARLFRSLLTAQVALESRAAADGALHVVLYGADAHLAEEISMLISANGEGGKSGIKDLAVKIDNVANLAALAQTQQLAGVFLISAQSEKDLAELVRWSTAAKVVLYSPFDGDVERGAAAGICIEAKVQPFLNLPALQAAGVEIKPFYIKVARVYP
jgi:hypothetical protein